MSTRSSLKSFVTAGFVSGLLVVAAAAMSAAMPGERAPDFVLKSAGGSNLRLSEYRGEVVAVAFWASWCGDCRDRLEQLDALTRRYAETGLVTLAVSLDGDRRQAREAAAAMQLDVPVLFDDSGDVAEIYAADSLPLVALVDRGGRLRDVFVGGDEETELAVTDRVRELLRE